jgi:glutamine synthetase
MQALESPIRAKLEAAGLSKVKVGAFDIDGVLRGKYISMDKLEASATSGFGFCDVIFGWDSADVLYDNVSYTGWHTGYPDMHATLDLDSLRTIPWEPGTAFFLADFVARDGGPLPIAPRQVLQRVVAKARQMGFEPITASEYEYFIFAETPETVRAKGYQNLTPLSPGMFGYSVLRASSHTALVHAILDGLQGFGIEVEGMHTETGPGVYESAIKYGPALKAGDDAALFKTAVKEIGARHGVMPVFMAKPSASLPGCSGHIHLSLWDPAVKTNLFHGEQGQPTDLARHFVAGQLALMPEMMALIGPTINSYKRTVPNTWAPTTASWGVENRTTALRWIPGGPKSSRVEYRLASADGNAYLALAAALASGLWGIERKLEPPPPTSQSAYSAPEGLYKPLPRTLEQATALLKASDAARTLLGDVFIDHFVQTREWEVRQFNQAVTTWELERYMEIV